MLPVIYSDDFLRHETGAFHPEQPGRLTAIKQALELAPWADQLAWRSPTPTTQRPVLAAVQRVHTPRYMAAVQQLAQRGGGHIDGDTPISAQSYEVALLAVSAWLDGVDAASQAGEPAFVLARPPGHHALSDTGMGFCVFSNAAIAAYYALDLPSVNRVAILDWDVHHGNGTQAIVETHPHLVYCSLHESPQYPGTGRATERGFHDNVLNIPLPRGSAIAAYQTAFAQQVLPFLHNFQPDLLIVSAGYDAAAADPLGGLALQPADYGILTQHCLGLTRRIVFGLEGGYDFTAIAQSVLATIQPCL